ncbi:hypothetical protein TRVL_04476 [Trypanosoma vivax]|nr:hypothetical protein TRVL_04476 [Trypanosoma vivax]
MWLQFFFVLLLSLSAWRGALGTASGVAVNCTNNGEKWTCEGSGNKCANGNLAEIIANSTPGKTGCERATCNNECKVCNCTRWTRHFKTVAKTGWTAVTYTLTERNEVTNLFNENCRSMACSVGKGEKNSEANMFSGNCRCHGNAFSSKQEIASISSYFPENCSSANCALDKYEKERRNTTVTVRCSCHQTVKTVGAAHRPAQTKDAPKEANEVKAQVEAEKPTRENVKTPQEQDTPKHTHTPVVSPSEEVKKMNALPQSNDNPNKSDTTLCHSAVGLALLFFMEAAQTQL